MKNFILLMVLGLGVLSLNAQTKKIYGVVSDESGPLPGASVVVKGSSKGVSTDFDGKYTIEVAEGKTLIFAYIGYVTQEIKVSKATIINVMLATDAHALEEVVVIGYAASKQKQSLGYAVSSVGSRSLGPSKAAIKRQKRKTYHNQIAAQLSGQVAGVNITTANGAPGGNASIIIRGVASSNLKNPLYIVDGTPIPAHQNSVVSQINPNAIEKVNVYRGGKAKQLFGKIAKNGCIVITTKSGTYEVENDENYAKITENQFQKATLNPLSTFSIDVDKAAYSNVRRLINNGQKVPLDAVKIEEMVNYFGYSYPQPTEHPFSINTETANTPWNTKTKLVRIGLQGKTYENEELPGICRSSWCSFSAY